MKQFSCKYCGSTDLFTEKRGSQTALCCGDCGKFNKWLPKDEINVFKYFKQNQRENVLDGWRSVKKDSPPRDIDLLFFNGEITVVARRVQSKICVWDDLVVRNGLTTSFHETSFKYWRPLPDAPTEEEMQQLDKEQTKEVFRMIDKILGEMIKRGFVDDYGCIYDSSETEEEFDDVFKTIAESMGCNKCLIDSGCAIDTNNAYVTCKAIVVVCENELENKLLCIEH